ncbi:MAG: glycosyltransferase family 4 protein [Alphaproteobacteria bacterium]|jgi:UDP-N-acetylmuramyl pentapeptide phosphotransferase/UDP-N-acetylglucosamine-1-phosphate transferase|nr:glycosyltransferase family 4 protein [Alphaproteobacteria bacterium]
MFDALLLFFILTSMALSALLTALVRKILLKRQMMDIPNERSMHKVPVPRGGGLAIVAVILAGLLFAYPNAYLLGGTLLLATISLIDDKKGLKASLRLFFHLVAAVIGLLALGHNNLLFGGVLPVWIDHALLVLGWAWFMNLYNFMDGIDGITGTQTITTASAVMIVIASAHLDIPFGDYFLIAFIIGACSGFLFFNWPPAKIFMGDVGSVPLGFLMGYLFLRLACDGHLLSALLIPLYYLADSGITLVRRALRREKIWQAHRQHFYQRATLGEGGPKKVLFSILLANIGLVFASETALSRPWLGSLVGVGIVLALLARLSLSARKNQTNR